MLPADFSKKHDRWIKIFDVAETRLHPDGYTLYKISSTVFQREYPEAETSLHIWRRYSAIKSLQKDILKLHLKLGLPGVPPEFKKPPLLTNRFDKTLIENRRITTLYLLQHCARHPALFSSEQFTQFFKEPETPKRKSLFLRRKSCERSSVFLQTSDFLEDLVPSSDSEVASDNVNGKADEDVCSDQTGTTAKLQKFETNDHVIGNPRGNFTTEECEEQSVNCSSPNLCSEKEVEIATETDLRKSINQQKSVLTEQIIKAESMCQSVSEENQRSLDLKLPVFSNVDHCDKSLMRRKTMEFFNRAEQLMTRLSSREGKVEQQSTKKNPKNELNSRKQLITRDSYLENYRVIGMAGKCILAVDKLTQKTVAIKVIEKTEKDLKIVPPCHIPYMIPLLKYHKGENSTFIVLKYIRGARLWDQLEKYLQHQALSFTIDSKPSYSGKRFFYEGLDGTDDEIIPNKIVIDSTAIEKDEVSDRNSFSTNLQLAISECKSTMDNFSKPIPLKKGFFVGSLSSLNYAPTKTGLCRTSKFDAYKSEVKSKSLDYLDSQEEKNFTLVNKPLNQRKISVNSIECDNASIGSDTLSGLSEDFSCSSLNPIAQSSECTNPKIFTCESQSYSVSNAELSKKINYEHFDVNKLIKNSKKLLEDVTATLERSKQQILVKVNSEKGIDRPKVSCSLEFGKEICNTNSLLDLVEDNADIQDSSTYLQRENSCLSLSTLLDTYSANRSQDGGSILPESLVRVWVSQIVSAFEALHNQGFIWGDFNISNLLLDDGGSILLTHYHEWASSRQKRHFWYSWGMDPRELESRDLDSWSLSQRQKNFAASLGYVAPELFSPLIGLSFSCDWWSVGALLYHLLTGQDVASAHPSGVNSHTQIIVPSTVTKEAASLINNLLCAHPSERLGGSLAGAQEIKCHPFFFGIQWSP